jgi:cell wall-associated NlpC family hydrolase
VSEGLTAVQARIAQLRSLMTAPSAAASAAPSATASATSTAFASALAQALATGTEQTSDLGTSSGGAGLAGLSDLTGLTGLGGSAGVSAAGGVDLGAAAVTKARQYTGVPYQWGGEDPATGMDCSGLVQYVYGSLGIRLPRVAADQSHAGTKVASLDAARPGDLVFFGTPAHHVGIYVGDDTMIDAPRTGKTIGVHRLWGTPSAIRRVTPEASATGAPSGTGGLSGPYASLFAAAGRRYGVDPALLSAVAKAESAYNPRAVSPAGAQGLMQLMPGTARSLGVSDPFEPSQAVDGAARLLADLLDDFGGRVDLALAGYNAGPGAVHRYGGVPPYTETQNYVRRVQQYREALA